MLTVGTDSYITAAEADTYINGHYLSTSAERQRWEAIESADKEVLLINACAEMERLSFRGRKAIFEQPLSFPRLPMQYGLSQEPPAAVKAAQAELALWLSDDETQNELSQRAALQDQGVESFSLGDLSESYAQGAIQNPLALRCQKAASLISQWVNGGFQTC